MANGRGGYGSSLGGNNGSTQGGGGGYSSSQGGAAPAGGGYTSSQGGGGYPPAVFRPGYSGQHITYARNPNSFFYEQPRCNSNQEVTYSRYDDRTSSCTIL